MSSYRNRRSYEDDYSYDNSNRRSYDGRRGRGVNFKKGNRGRRNFVSSKGFERAMSNIRHNQGHNRYQDSNDFEELSELDPAKWHKISVIFGAQSSKEWIAGKICELAQEDIKLVNYQIEGKNVVAFFKAKRSVVRTIRRQSHDFVDALGKRLTVNITCVMEPSISRLTDNIENEIKISLNSRYNFETKRLDLSAFCRDDYLNSVNLNLSLSRQTIAQYVVGILTESLPELSTLVLSNNELESLVNFKPFVEKFPNLKSLDISFNRCRHDAVLEIFKPCRQIESLSVQGNPFFRAQTVEAYGTLIRERFPNLLHLNEKKLPPRMKFGGGESTKNIPESVLGHFPSDDIRDGLLNFLKSFFEKYDSGKRDCLLDAYSDDATLTFCVVPRANELRRSVPYYPDNLLHLSRNLLRVREDEKRKRMVFRGKLQVVSTLDRLPKTEHILDSFRVDVIYNNESSIFLNITGVMREIGEEKIAIRTFSRTMQINMNKILIDNFIVGNPSVEIEKKYRDSGNVVKSDLSPAVPAPKVNQDTLIRDMMRETGMNFNFSRQCLSDYEFNYREALKAFLQLREANMIPPDAYS